MSSQTTATDGTLQPVAQGGGRQLRWIPDSCGARWNGERRVRGGGERPCSIRCPCRDSHPPPPTVRSGNVHYSEALGGRCANNEVMASART